MMMLKNKMLSFNYRFVILFVLPVIFGFSSADALPKHFPMPEFTNTNPNEWFNTKPLKRDDLKGKVVLLDIWTYGCWNCYRSFPWLNELEAKFSADAFIVIGIHTPEFEKEKKPSSVARNVRKFNLHHPVMMDNDFAYWKALGNRYWPTFYIVDKQGIIRSRYIGETHSGDRNATRIEADIRQLLGE